MIEVRPPKNPEEVRQIEEIQLATWGANERSITPHNVLIAWMHAGGIVLGAFDGDKMIGFAASFLGEIQGKRAQWSHIAAVLPDYRRRGVGRLLKFGQREHALKRGIDLMGWTYDPLRKENAIFNVEGLGVTCNILHLEIYGHMEDELNKGRLSDRFEVHWKLNDRRVKDCVSGKRQPFSNPKSPKTYVAQMVNGEPLVTLPENPDAPEYAIELPAHVEGSGEPVHQWNYALRATAIPLFAAGYSVDRIYIGRPETFAYVLKRSTSWYLYVLETADGTFYTGITTDLEHRLSAHNQGRGAKYTATRRPVKLLAAWEVYGKSRATQLEHQFKGLSRPQKETAISSRGDFEGAKRVI
jgi:predicted GNAT superfamily acetyltransferase